jgi:PDDEXK-like uncharacterized protein DUF3799
MEINMPLLEEELPFVCDISNEEYHSLPGISNSGLKAILDCPYKYWDRYVNPNRLIQTPTAAMRFGTMVHMFILEPEKFDTHYFYGGITIRRGTKAFAELEVVANGREIIFDEDREILYHIKKAIDEHPIAGHLFKNGEAEKSIFWKDPETQMLCKSRPDYMTPNYIIDLKTTRSASPQNFERTIMDEGYHRQAAMALSAMEAISGIAHTNFLNVCIETERPYIISVFVVSDEALKLGQQEYKEGLRIYKECLEKNHWPQYVEEIKEINLPIWALKKIKGESHVAYS